MLLLITINISYRVTLLPSFYPLIIALLPRKAFAQMSQNGVDINNTYMYVQLLYLAYY